MRDPESGMAVFGGTGRSISQRRRPTLGRERPEALGPFSLFVDDVRSGGFC